MSNPKERPWWAKEESAAQPPAPRYRAVAYYRHSAKDRQENSVAIQQELVTKWAEENGVDIIHEFADRGKSGLTADGRDGFTNMMEHWVKKRDDFRFVLCLDVSRWGRFQDMDLSATYSAECKQHGKDVIYTTIGMPRPDDPMYPFYLQFERFRAAQYSKELSVKVFHGCITIAKQGYWVGGNPPYGYDRLLLDEDRRPVHVLEHYQKKSIQNQRVTLTPGDQVEVEAVRRIFQEFVKDSPVTHLTRGQRLIAEGLNRDGIRAARGGLWDAAKVHRILTNPMYAGTLVYNKTRQKLKTPRRRNPEDQWIKTSGAFEPVVDPELFQQAQFIFAQAALRYAPEVMISHLERIHREFGFVRASLLQADETSPSASTYAKHFKSLDTAYQRVFSSTLVEIAEEVETTLRDQVDQIERYDDFLVINRSFTVLVQPSVPVPYGYQQYWYFRPDLRSMIDITLGVPVSGIDGGRILGYLALCIRQYTHCNSSRRLERRPATGADGDVQAIGRLAATVAGGGERTADHAAVIHGLIHVVAERVVEHLEVGIAVVEHAQPYIIGADNEVNPERVGDAFVVKREGRASDIKARFNPVAGAGMGHVVSAGDGAGPAVAERDAPKRDEVSGRRRSAVVARAATAIANHEPAISIDAERAGSQHPGIKIELAIATHGQHASTSSVSLAS